jgi:hypothetical protein
MAQAEATLFIVGVFKDLSWAERGVDALKAKGFAPQGLSVLSKASPEATAFAGKVTGAAPLEMELPAIGQTTGMGSLVQTLDGPDKDLARVGIAAAMRRAGFQPHDGLIYETLIGKGGVLVAIEGAPRASDALEVMLSYGGGNAAIGAWAGRV